MKKILSLVCVMLCFQLSSDLVTWNTTPTTISTSGVDSSNVQVGIDDAGDMVAVWIENGYVKSSAATHGGSWSTPFILSNAGATNPSLVVDSNGNATAIWVEGTTVNTASCVLNGSWSSAKRLVATGGSAPGLSVDGSGNVVAIWVQSGGIYSAKHPFGGSWSTPAMIASSGDSPQVAISSNGSVVAVWHSLNSISKIDTIFGSLGSLTGSWAAAQAISNSTQNSILPQVAIDLNGNAAAAWFSFNLSNLFYTNVVTQASTLSAGQYSWSLPATLSNAGVANPNNLFLQVMFSNSGPAITAWTNCYDGVNYNLEGTIYSSGVWGQSTVIAEDTNLYGASLGLNPLGDAFVAYMMSNPTSGANVLTAESVICGVGGGSWNNQLTLSNTNTVNGYPSIAISTGTTNIYGAIGWVSYDGSNKIIQVTSGSAQMILPPTNLAISQSSSNNKLFTQYNNLITWNRSTSDNISLYILYRNGIFITYVQSSVTQYTDLNRDPAVNDTYGIASFNNQTGEQSEISTIQF